MSDQLEPLTPQLLGENYAYWAGQVGGPTLGEHLRIAQLLPTTHTFPYEIIREFSGELLHWHIWREVLLEDGALLSEAQRWQRRPDRVGKLDRIAVAARKTNLFKFVFTYLGAHEGYYSRTKDTDHPAFGVFVSLEAEQPLPDGEGEVANATRRDLGSPEAGSIAQNEFLVPGEARRLAAAQTSTDPRHKGDFWHYWGSVNYLAEEEYRDKRWQWLFEFHFPTQVPVARFAAILWPCERKGLPSGSSVIEYIGDGKAFRDNYPSCAVIQYHWDSDDPFRRLLHASEVASRMYLENGRFPDMVDPLPV